MTIATRRFSRGVLRRRHELLDALREAADALAMRRDVARARRGALRRAAAEHDRRGGAVEFGNRDHHRRFDRREAALGGLPLLDRLEFERLPGDIGHVEFAEHPAAAFESL